MGRYVQYRYLSEILEYEVEPNSARRLRSR